MTIKRKKVHKNTQADILRDISLRRCALCFEYNFDFDLKKGQIAHIDKNSSNNKKTNLVYLCLDHHDEYDGQTSQSKGFTQEELRRSMKSLYAAIKKHQKEMLPKSMSSMDSKPTTDKKTIIKKKRHIISPEIYNLRIPIYHAYRDLIQKAMGLAKIDMDDLFEFTNKTHEALFLYDENMAEFINQVFEKGIRFRCLNIIRKNPCPVDKKNLNSIIEEEANLLRWFRNNFEEGQKLFKQYLHFG